MKRTYAKDRPRPAIEITTHGTTDYPVPVARLLCRRCNNDNPIATVVRFPNGVLHLIAQEPRGKSGRFWLSRNDAVYCRKHKRIPIDANEVLASLGVANPVLTLRV